MPDHTPLDGSGEVAISDDLDGLAPNTSYRVRVFASNALTENTSAVTTFSTLLVAPVVQTGPAAGVTDSQAELTGTIDTIGAQTTYHFEYGLDHQLRGLGTCRRRGRCRQQSHAAGLQADDHEAPAGYDLPLPARRPQRRRCSRRRRSHVHHPGRRRGRAPPGL